MPEEKLKGKFSGSIAEGSLYLVVNPAAGKKILLEKLQQALEGGVRVLQIWNNWPSGWTHLQKKELIEAVIASVSRFRSSGSMDKIPVLMNEEWQWLESTDLDGIHFDRIPENIEEIRRRAGRDFIAGITCGNDLGIIEWASRHGFDYVSFCSMFPSESAGECEIVRPETVKKARDITNMPIFLSGGITPENLPGLQGLGFNGIAVISGIMSAARPDLAAKEYADALNQLKPSGKPTKQPSGKPTEQ